MVNASLLSSLHSITETGDQPNDVHNLFNNDGLTYFRQHGLITLLTRKNANVGSLFVSERAPFYLNILYRILLFKRDYELEPLYDDIYYGMYSAQSTLDQYYNQDQFRTDINQLGRWELVEFRIEKQRLRGYRDNRKRKFRYRLKSAATYFWEWLEQRCLDDKQSQFPFQKELTHTVANGWLEQESWRQDA